MFKPGEAPDKVVYYSMPSGETQAVIVTNGTAYYLSYVSHLDSLWGYSDFNSHMVIKDSSILSFLLELNEDKFPLTNSWKECQCAITKNDMGISFNGNNWLIYPELKRCKIDCPEMILARISEMFDQLKK